MILPYRAAEHLAQLQTVLLRVLATAALVGVRVATRINERRSRPGSITRAG